MSETHFRHRDIAVSDIHCRPHVAIAIVLTERTHKRPPKVDTKRDSHQRRAIYAFRRTLD